MYAVNSPEFRADIESFQSGSTRKRISRTNLAKIELPVPPLSEQEHIVARIEELFTQLDAGVAALKRVQAGLKRYKVSVLKAACEGRLLGHDDLGRGAASLRPVRVRPYEIAAPGKLPEGWQLKRLGDIAEVRLGRQRSPSHAYGPNMKPYMRAANVTWDGIDLSDVKEMDFSPREQEIYRLRFGDILLSEASGSISEVGKPAVWKDQLPESYIQNTLMRVRPYKDFSDYLYIIFLYDAMTERFRLIAKGVGIHHLGAGNMSNWMVNLPPLVEQRRIVAEVEQRLSVAKEVESAVEVALARAARLRQAVLKAAFEGRL